MSKFFRAIRYSALMIIIMAVAAGLVIIITHDQKGKGRDYQIQIDSYVTDVHVMENCKTYYLAIDKAVDEKEASVIVFRLFEMEQNPIYLTIDWSVAHLYVTTFDGIEASFTR